jgi:glutamate-1-semialdehyde 2,1-aminomutase
VREAAIQAVDRGWSLGTAEPYSLELAELICARIPWVESVRFVNSGTEALMSALRVARGATGRAKVLKFEGCYHGHADSFLIRSGSGLAGLAVADSAGIAPSVLTETLVAPLNDIEGLKHVFEMHGAELAAVVIEPVPANYGLLPQTNEFLKTLAALARQHGALLILDEVITGFRVSFGGYAQLSGVRPDLVTYGKIIGGGFPVGAYGGRADLMNLVAPAGPVYQAGTLSANPVAMCAGLAALRVLEGSSPYQRLEALGQRLEDGLARLPGVLCQRVGSVFWLCVSPAARGAVPIRALSAIPADAAESYKRMFGALLQQRIYLAPSAYEVGFISLAHTEAHIDELVGAVSAALS